MEVKKVIYSECQHWHDPSPVAILITGLVYLKTVK